MKILHLTLTKKWFDMILSGEKTEEYRQIKPYWTSRLVWTDELVTPKEFAWSLLNEGHACIGGNNRTCFARYDFVEFRNGYSKDAPAMTVECKGITTGIGNPDLGAPTHPVFIIKLGAVLETGNCENLKN